MIAYSSNQKGKFDIWVQQIGTGDPLQITHDSGQNWQPEWSPDGKYIAYRSEKGEGGLYVIPALGGTPRKISNFGYYPRWSPDGTQILFQPVSFGILNSLFVVSLDGGEPKPVLSQFFAQHQNVSGRSAAWHPDGKRISVYVWDYKRATPVFWTVPVNGGAAYKSEIDPELLKHFGGTGEGRFVADTRFCWAPSGNAIYFERTFAAATNLWKMRVDQKTLQGLSIERLTTGPGNDTGLSLSADGKKLAFSAESRRIQIWVAPLDSKSGELTGTGEAVTSPGIEAWIPALSPDGENLIFSGNVGKGWQIWQKSLASGKEALLADGDSYTRAYPALSADGKVLAYVRTKSTGAEHSIVISPLASAEEKVIADANEYDLYGWSPDGRQLVVSKWNADNKTAEVWLVPIRAPASEQKIAANSDFLLFQGQVSPNARWVAFEAIRDTPTGRESTIYVVPARGGQWIRVTDSRQWDDKPRWSTDGKGIYFISARGGFYNVWKKHFDPATGRLGTPSRVTEFDNPGLMIPNYVPDVGLSITAKRLAVTISQSSGGIWILDDVGD
jgi:Tol biopolymer transport system component